MKKRDIIIITIVLFSVIILSLVSTHKICREFIIYQYIPKEEGKYAVATETMAEMLNNLGFDVTYIDTIKGCTSYRYAYPPFWKSILIVSFYIFIGYIILKIYFKFRKR